MKIEMLESLGCSYLRHVRSCWIVQTNWKVSENWSRRKSTDHLEPLFQDMKGRFDGDANEVFKGTKGAEQFLRQAEVDVLGVDFKGDVHALEVAFHEAGLHYVGKGGTRGRVLKKLLRTYLVLQAFAGFSGRAHVCFISPKVNPSTASALGEVFDQLRRTYPDVDWHLHINESFASEVLHRTLAATKTAADTSELFVRAAKLIQSDGYGDSGSATRTERSPSATERLQPLVQEIMRTLLERRDLLNDERTRLLLDTEYCKRDIGLRIGNLPLLRQKRDGVEVKGRPRYWANVYPGSYHVCSQWRKADHLRNARSLFMYLAQLREANPDGPDMAVLNDLSAKVSAYIDRNSTPET